MNETPAVKDTMYEVSKRMYKIAINNCFHYIISSQEPIKNIITEMHKNQFNVPKGPFEKAIKILKGKEKQLVKKAIPYAEYITYWNYNFQDCILDYEWIFNIQQTTNIRFHQVCDIIDVDVELIKRLFNNMKKLNLSEMIELHKRFKTSNKYKEKYEEMIAHLNFDLNKEKSTIYKIT